MTVAGIDVAVAPVDSDSRVDIVVLSYIEASFYNILRGQPERTFIAPETFHILNNAGPVASGDSHFSGFRI